MPHSQQEKNTAENPWILTGPGSRRPATAIRYVCFAVGALILSSPGYAVAAATAISCVLTKEDIFMVSKNSPNGTSVQRDITRNTKLTVTDTALLTLMEPPCDRFERTEPGADSGADIDVTCSLMPAKDMPASLRIQLDRRLGTISETWDIIESDGSKFRYSGIGTCSDNAGS
jgi:hypothetical protein